MDSKKEPAKKIRKERPLHDEAAPAKPLSDEHLYGGNAQRQREASEPALAEAPIPLFLLLIAACVMFWGGFYLAKYSGDFQSDVFTPDFSRASMAAAKPYDPIAHGEKIFKGKGNCVTCHQANGQGLPGTYPPLDGSPYVTGPKERMVKILIYGLGGPIEVLGHTYNNNMPPIGSFSDKEIAAVASYVRRAWSNKADAIDEALVAEVRKATAGRTQPWTVSEL